MTPRAREFQKELKALILKYRPEVTINSGYYGDIFSIDFTVDEVICASKDYDEENCWDFGDGMQQLPEPADTYFFKSLSHYMVKDKKCFAVENPRTCRDFDHLIGKFVEIDGTRFQVFAVDRFAHAPPYMEKETIGLVVFPS